MREAALPEVLEVERDAPIIDLQGADAGHHPRVPLGLGATLRSRWSEGADVDADRLTGGARRTGRGVEQPSRATVSGLQMLVELSRGEHAQGEAQGLAGAAFRQVEALLLLVVDDHLGRNRVGDGARHAEL